MKRTIFDVSDVHTHKLKHDAVVNRFPGEPMPEGYLYSVGVHPWYAADTTPAQWEQLERDALRPDVVAIGEAGIDGLCGVPMDVQKKAFERQIMLSERVGKPLIIHDVRAHQDIIAAHTRFKPLQPWVIHGFRGKPEVAEMFLRRGIYISVGPVHNLRTVAIVPPQMLLHETDEME